MSRLTFEIKKKQQQFEGHYDGQHLIIQISAFQFLKKKGAGSGWHMPVIPTLGNTRKEQQDAEG